MRLLFFTFLVSLSCLSQKETYEYSCLFYSQCSGEIMTEKTFVIWDESSEKPDESMQLFNTSALPITLKKNHAYRIALLAYIGETYTINSQGEGQVDTFYISMLNHSAMISNPPQIYYTHCGEPANGFLKDHYANGNVKTQGHFKDGIAVDTVLRFYDSGILKEIDIRKNADFEFLSYYPNGTLKSHRKTDQCFGRQYFENGQLQQEKSWKGNKHKLLQYDSTGTLRRKETEKIAFIYSKNGVCTEKINRKTGKEEFRYEWSFFDPEENLIRRIYFSGSGMRFEFQYYPLQFEDIPLENLNSIQFYSDGKAVKKLNIEMDMTRYGEAKKVHILIKKDGKWVEENVFDFYELPKVLEGLK